MSEQDEYRVKLHEDAGVEPESIMRWEAHLFQGDESIGYTYGHTRDEALENARAKVARIRQGAAPDEWVTL